MHRAFNKALGSGFVVLSLIASSFVHMSPAAAQTSGCDAQVGDAAGLVAAITMANDEAQCPGRNTITLTANITPDHADPNGTTDAGLGNSAFPMITSDIIIQGAGENRVMINANSGKFRFFYVDAKQHDGRLTLINLELANGGRVDKGGAIFVDGTSNLELGDTLLTIVNSYLHDNQATAGGAIRLEAGQSSRVRALIVSSIFEKNSADQGAAIYNSAREKGIVVLQLVNSRLANNTSRKEGGALYTNLTKDSNVTIDASQTEFLSNVAGGGPNKEQCFENGRNLDIGGTNVSTDASCGSAAPVADPGTPFSQKSCVREAGDVAALIAAIEETNNVDMCPNADIIRLTANIQPTAAYNNGDTAFPAIKGVLIIDGESAAAETTATDYVISRDAGAPAFRFFTVDGANGGNADLTLQNITLEGGSDGTGVAGGAVFVDARTNGKAAISVDNATFKNNSTTGGNGGAIGTLSVGGGSAEAVITNSTFDGNSGAYGGAFYNGGFDGGHATATIVHTTFSNNKADVQGGATYNNGLNGKAVLNLEVDTFTGNTAPAGGAIYNNGRANGSAELMIATTTFDGNAASNAGAGDALYNEGAAGSTAVTGAKANVPPAENTCFNGSTAMNNNALVGAACP